MWRSNSRKKIVVVTFVAAAGVGFVVHGWWGVLLWPAVLCSIVLWLGIGLFLIDLVLTIIRHQNEVSRIRARVRRLSNGQLRDLCANPSNRDSGMARVELMRRGEDGRPTKEQIFEMLTSGDAMVCGQAMGYVHMFYPELCDLMPKGSSNRDSAEVWGERVRAVRGGGRE